MGTGEFNPGGNPVIDNQPIQGGVEILLVSSCYRNCDKLCQYGPLGLMQTFSRGVTLCNTSATVQ